MFLWPFADPGILKLFPLGLQLVVRVQGDVVVRQPGEPLGTAATTQRVNSLVTPFSRRITPGLPLPTTTQSGRLTTSKSRKWKKCVTTVMRPPVTACRAIMNFLWIRKYVLKGERHLNLVLISYGSIGFQHIINLLKMVIS